MTDKRMKKPFKITSVCRLDVVAAFYDTKKAKVFAGKLTDGDMDELARHLASILMTGGEYYEGIRICLGKSFSTIE